jgi:hypothetical protein
MAKRSGLTPAQIGTIRHILAGKSVTGALKAAKTPRRTYYRWLEDPVFRAALEDEKNDLIKRGRFELEALLLSAIQVLATGLEAKESLERFRSASKVLEIIFRFKDIDIENELAEIERLIKERIE